MQTICQIYGKQHINGEKMKTLSFDNLVKHLEAYLVNYHQAEFDEWHTSFSSSNLHPIKNHKKNLELFISHKILDIKPTDVYMDVACGNNNYLSTIKCRKKIAQDLKLSRAIKKMKDVDFVESDASDIPLKANSIDKISCHHSFEHFHDDTGFIKEIHRLLKPKGICCIVPLFILDKYAEITNSRTKFKKLSPNNPRLVCDTNSSLPGSRFSGNFARIYDIPTLKRRILSEIDSYRICEIFIDNKGIPDLSLTHHKKVSKFNYPYRSLIIEGGNE